MIDITKTVYFYEDRGRGLSFCMDKVLCETYNKCLCNCKEDGIVLFDIETGEVETTNFMFYYATNTIPLKEKLN